MCGMNALTKHATRIAVSANGLRKAYGEKVVLDGVDLSRPAVPFRLLLAQTFVIDP